MRERGIYPRRSRLLEAISEHESSENAAAEVASPENDQTPPLNQPIFSCHAGVNEQPKELRHANANAREIHHVVVPYTPLMYSRFYDWPPEPQYAQVVPDMNGDAFRRLHPVNNSLNRGSNHTRSSGSTATGGLSGNGSSPMTQWKQSHQSSSLRSIKSDRPKRFRSLFSRSSGDESKQS